MNKKTLIAAAITSITLLAAIPAISHSAGYKNGKGNCDNGQMMKRGGKRGDMDPGAMSERKLERMSATLELTEEQESRIKAILEQNTDDRLKSRQAMQDNRQALRNLNPSDADYDAKVEQYASVLSDMQKEKIISKSSIRKQISEVLTDEQQEKMASLKQDRRGKSGRF